MAALSAVFSFDTTNLSGNAGLYLPSSVAAQASGTIETKVSGKVIEETPLYFLRFHRAILIIASLFLLQFVLSLFGFVIYNGIVGFVGAVAFFGLSVISGKLVKKAKQKYCA